jgi:predicted nucleic acid-binding protein
MQKTQKTEILINTSSWINIFEIGLNSYLIESFRVHTTPKVVEEIREGEDFAQDAKVFIDLIDKKQIHVQQKSKIPEEIRHEISITSGEMELASAAFENGKFIVLIDDARVYRVLERVGIKYISSVHIVIDAYLTGSIEKKQALLMLDKLRISISDSVIEKAKDVILKWK